MIQTLKKKIVEMKKKVPRAFLEKTNEYLKQNKLTRITRKNKIFFWDKMMILTKKTFNWENG